MLDLQVERSGLVGCRARIVTKSAIFYCALIMRETEKTITVSYVSKTDRDTGHPQVEMEIVKKEDIDEFRRFAD